MGKPFREIEKYQNRLKGSVIEVGSERFEGSTCFLADFCHRNNLKFYSVDFEIVAHQRAKLIPNTIAVQMKAEDFLKNIFPKDERICFAYLDGFDYIFDEIKDTKAVIGQIDTYKQYGLELNNENSKKSHLEIARLLLDFVADKCFVMFDDTWGVNGAFEGKGGYAVPFLLENGFKVIEQNVTAKPWNCYIIVCNSNGI